MATKLPSSGREFHRSGSEPDNPGARWCMLRTRTLIRDARAGPNFKVLINDGLLRRLRTPSGCIPPPLLNRSHRPQVGLPAHACRPGTLPQRGVIGECDSTWPVRRHVIGTGDRVLLGAGRPDLWDYCEPLHEQCIAVAEPVSPGRAGVVLPATFVATGGWQDSKTSGRPEHNRSPSSSTTNRATGRRRIIPSPPSQAAGSRGGWARPAS